MNRSGQSLDDGNMASGITFVRDVQSRDYGARRTLPSYNGDGTIGAGEQ